RGVDHARGHPRGGRRPGRAGRAVRAHGVRVRRLRRAGPRLRAREPDRGSAVVGHVRAARRGGGRYRQVQPADLRPARRRNASVGGCGRTDKGRKNESRMSYVPYARARWDEIVPGLWQGGHDYEPTGDLAAWPSDVVVDREFDLVISLYTLSDSGPAH